jgi:hypothetical protein
MAYSQDERRWRRQRRASPCPPPNPRPPPNEIAGEGMQALRHRRVNSELCAGRRHHSPIVRLLRLEAPQIWSCGTTLRGNQGRLGVPPQAARTEGPPQTRPRRMDQSREAHHPARPHQSPEGAMSPHDGLGPAATPGSRGPQALTLSTGHRSRRSRASIRAARSWSERRPGRLPAGAMQPGTAPTARRPCKGRQSAEGSHRVSWETAWACRGVTGD